MPDQTLLKNGGAAVCPHCGYARAVGRSDGSCYCPNCNQVASASEYASAMAHLFGAPRSAG